MSKAEAYKNPERFATKAIRLNTKASDAKSIAPAVEERLLAPGPDEVVVEVKAAE